MANSPTPPAPLGELYRASRERISAMVINADPNCAVPATPLWDVHDVVAHLAGVVEDAVMGNMDGVTTEPWTAAQVERGRGRSVMELLEIWSAGAALVETVLSAGARENDDPAVLERFTRAVLDVFTHEADLAHALNGRAQIPADGLSWASAVLQKGFHSCVADLGLGAVAVDASDWEWFRGRLGRRTAAEVKALGWSDDPEPYLTAWFVFGRAIEPLGEQPPQMT
jgi:hypothetical protein